MNEQETLSDQQVEIAVLSGILLSKTAMLEVYPVLRPDMFLDSERAFIYEAMCALYLRGEKIDMITVEAEMHKMDEARWKESRGLKELLPSFVEVRHGSALKQYVEEVKRLYMLRMLGMVFLTMQGKSMLYGASYTQVIEEAEQALLDLREKATVGRPMQGLGETANKVLEMHRERLRTGKDSMRILTGIEEFDYVTGGLYRGELAVEGGRPGDGKTAVAMHIAMNVALSGKHVCFFSLEMTDFQTMNRIFAGYADVDATNLRVEGATKADLKKMETLAEKLKNVPLHFDFTPANSVENVRSQVLLQKKKGRCDLIVVDYLHLLERKGTRQSTMDQMIGRNIEALKRLAVEADCPVLVLSQMNRESEERTGDKAHLPAVHNLRDSGVIEQVADCVFFVYRPERHGILKDEKTGASLRGVGKLYILKARNGPTGIARYRYNESYTRITNYNLRSV